MAKDYMVFSGSPEIKHLTSGIQGEHTVCGYAFDSGGGQGANAAIGDEAAISNHGPVTCKFCIMEIDNCRGVKTERIE